MYSTRFLSNASRRFSIHTLWRALLIPLIGALLVPLAGCDDNPVGGNGGESPNYDPAPATFEVEGTVERQHVKDEKAWVLESTDGQTYLPVNLGEEHRQRGVRVTAEVTRVGDRAREQMDRERKEIDRLVSDPAVGELGLVRIKEIELLPLGKPIETPTPGGPIEISPPTEPIPPTKPIEVSQ